MVGTKLVQCTNVSPTATLEQLRTLFGFLGKIEEIQIFPKEDTVLPVTSRVCFVKYEDESSVGVSQHLTNTVFIDRALIVVPCMEVPEEHKALQLVSPNNGVGGLVAPTPPAAAVTLTEVPGGGLLPTPAQPLLGQIPSLTATGTTASGMDPTYAALGLPQPPPLNNVDPSKIEEIRRTIYVGNLDSAQTVTAEQLLTFFQGIGEVKYVRMAGDETQPTRFAFVEFTEHASVAKALTYNGVMFAGRPLKINHSNNAIVKPPAKTAEAAQRELAETMKQVRDAQALIQAAIEPSDLKLAAGIPQAIIQPAKETIVGVPQVVTKVASKKDETTDEKKKRKSRSRSHSRHRSRSRSRRSRSRSRRRSRSRDHRRGYSKSRRSRSRTPPRRRSRTPPPRRRSPRRRSRTRSPPPPRRRIRSRSRSRDKRSRSRDRRRRSKTPPRSYRVASRSPPPRRMRRSKTKSLSRSKSRSKSRSRSNSPRRRHKKEKKSRDRERSRERDRGSRKHKKDKERDRERKDKERERDRSPEREKDGGKKSKSKVKRDYDEEEKGYDSDKERDGGGGGDKEGGMKIQVVVGEGNRPVDDNVDNLQAMDMDVDTE